MKGIIFIAPPAAGKGTQSTLITEKYNIPHISTGDLLREKVSVGDTLGNFIQQQMSTGGLVSDEIILKLLEERINKSDCNNGYILDGFPRNVDQAKAYEDILTRLNKTLGDVILLDITKQTARERIVGRASCPTCGAIYNEFEKELMPKKQGVCDKCGTALIKREDDNEETFSKRFDTYLEKTAPLIKYYQDKGVLFSVNSGIDKDFTFNAIEEVIHRND